MLKVSVTKGGDEVAEKDIAEKTLEGYNDVFADIANVLLFNGRRLINPDDLEDRTPNSSYKVDGKIHGQERDVAKAWRNGTIRLACIGTENQTRVDKQMPLRIIGYDGAEYRSQYDSKEPKYPVVTFVLYFGTNPKWNDEISLRDCLEIPEELKEYVNDYKVKIFSVAYLPKEKVEQFTSDFRIVADYFVQQRLTNDYVPNPQTIDHVKETLELLSVMGDDHRFIEAYNENKEKSAEGGIHTMSDALNTIIGRETEKAEKKGVDLMAKLVKILLAEKKYSDVEKVSDDAEYRDKLLKEYKLVG